MAPCAQHLQLPTASLHALRRQAGRGIIPPPRPRRRPRSAIVAAMDAGGPGPVVVRRLLPLLLPTGLDPSPPPSWSELLLPLPFCDAPQIGCGAINVDYLATVASFPNPDDKIRSLELKVQGGGNTGNALTAAARLGLRPRVISKVRS